MARLTKEHRWIKNAHIYVLIWNGDTCYRHKNRALQGKIME